MGNAPESTGAAIVRRFRAGESPVDLAPEYDTTVASVLDCVLWAVRGYRGDPPVLETRQQERLDC